MSPTIPAAQSDRTGSVVCGLSHQRLGAMRSARHRRRTRSAAPPRRVRCGAQHRTRIVESCRAGTSRADSAFRAHTGSSGNHSRIKPACPCIPALSILKVFHAQRQTVPYQAITELVRYSGHFTAGVRVGRVIARWPRLPLTEEERAISSDDILDGAGAVRLVDRGGKCLPQQEL